MAMKAEVKEVADSAGAGAAWLVLSFYEAFYEI